MRVAIGSDHAGYELKEAVRRFLVDEGVTVDDVGTHSPVPVDYPDFAVAVGRAVSEGRADCGILVCGTGIGMAMAANKIPGIRAASVTDLESARLAREHNNINVLALAGRLTPADRARDIVRVFLETPYAGGRHQPRLDKIAALDGQRPSPS